MAEGSSRAAMKTLSVAVKEGRFRLEAMVKPLGPDLLVAVWGGTHPHIGAVALALPRSSLRDRKKTSATSSVLTLLGHKEDVTAKMVSETLAAALKQNVVVTVGIHWDNLKAEEIEGIIRLTDRLTKKIIEKTESPSPQPSPLKSGERE
jgi:gallate decarboxylase subunit D